MKYNRCQPLNSLGWMSLAAISTATRGAQLVVSINTEMDRSKDQNGLSYSDGVTEMVPRGSMKDHLHPLYKNIMKEYLTDGRHYYSSDGKQQYAADKYYKVVEADIRKSAKLLPLTVSGDIAWVAAQTSPTHLRLTVIDGGYINSKSSAATVSFHTVKPLKMVDLLDKKSFDIADPSAVKVAMPCGMFRLIDIELKNNFWPVGNR